METSADGTRHNTYSDNLFCDDMADSDTPQPERTDLDFDLDFELGDLDFDDTAPSPAPIPGQKQAGNVLSRDLESLLDSQSAAGEPDPLPDPEPEPLPESAPEPEPDFEPEIEELPESDPAPDPIPVSEVEEVTEDPIDEAPLVELEEVDELEEIDDLEEVEIDEIQPVEEIEAPEPEPATEDEQAPEIEPEPEMAAETDAAKAAAMRRRVRRSTPAPSPLADLDDELVVSFDDPDDLVVGIPQPADPIASIEGPPELEEIQELETPSLPSEAAVVPDEELEALTAKLEEGVLEPSDTPAVPVEIQDGLEDDEFEVELEDELHGVGALAPRKIEVEPPSFKDDELEIELEDELEDLGAPVVTAAAGINSGAEELVETTSFEDDELDDELDDLGAPAAEIKGVAEEVVETASFDDDELEIELEDDDELGDLDAPAHPAAGLPVKETVAAAAALAATASVVAKVKDVELESGANFEDDADEFEVATPEIVEATSAPESDAEPEGSSESNDEAAAADDDHIGSEIEDDLLDDDAKPSRGMFSFRPLELAGLAAVLIACAVGLFMLNSNVSGVLKIAREGAEMIAEDPPTKVEGELVQIGSIECYWRDREEGDRTDKDSVILPVVNLGEPSGSGIVQVLFRDSTGDIRGDGHSFPISGGSFTDSGTVATALCTEGLQNEAQYRYYRSDSTAAKRYRWNVRIRESADGIEWKELAAFEIPPTRKKP